MRQIQDDIVIERSLQGDPEAFEALVKKYQSSLIALTWNILGDPDEACDMVQETFLQVYTHLERFDRTRSFKTWIFSIAVKRCIDRIRKKKSFLKYFNRQTKEINPVVERKNKRIEEPEIFSPLLKKLNHKERVAISLKVNEGFSAREISEIIKCSESTVRVHLFNAKKKLKELIG